MAKTYRTGIIGCGGMGRAHSNAYTFGRMVSAIWIEKVHIFLGKS